MAVTGSVNQHGFAQVIGGVNEKIEGFFDICKARGLTGDQGVLIPKNNVQHLMLREDVIEAVSQAQFDIYPFETVDEAVELLTGVAAGERDASGKFPVDTVNYLVETKLREFAEVRKNFARERTKSGRRRADRGKS
jgi:predicted ATP-dependent protease